jgi:hypothetical protein
MMDNIHFFQISVKYDELRKQDKNWKGKTDPEKQSLWVDAALQVLFAHKLLHILAIHTVRIR